ncbi:MAG: tetratricopeptide repeat protein [Planctomycetota bacterium]
MIDPLEAARPEEMTATNVPTPPAAPWCYILLIVAGLVAYSNSIRVPFLLDDGRAIAQNPYVREFVPPFEMLNDKKMGATRPLVLFTLQVNYAVSSLDVWSYHATNLLIHLASAILLFEIVRRALRTEPVRELYAAQAEPLGLAVALLWVVHPLASQGVTYLVQRGESMMGLFIFLTLYCVLRASEGPHRSLWQAGAILACAAGMLCKEAMAAAPLVVFLFDRTFLGQSVRNVLRERKWLYAGLAASSLIVVGMLLHAGRSVNPADEIAVLPDASRWRYLMTQTGVLVHYLHLSVWPHPLVFDYYWPWAENPGDVIVPGIIILLLLVGTFWGLVKNLPIAFLGAWFFVLLAPTSSFMPLDDAAAEHRMYLPLVAPIILLVLALHHIIELIAEKLARPSSANKVFTCVIAAMALVFCGLTYSRNRDYRSSLAMWTDVVAKRPRNPRAHYNLAVELNDAQEYGRAIQHLQATIKLHPGIPHSYNLLGTILCRQGSFDDGTALIRHAIGMHPNFPLAHYNLAVFEAERGKWDVAEAEFLEALRIQPALYEARLNLGVLYARQGKLNEAVREFQICTQLRPDSQEARNNLRRAIDSGGKLPGNP